MSTLQGRQEGASPPVDPTNERQQRVLEQFRTYPFHSDDAFQQGLVGILAHHPSTDQLSDSEKSELILKTKVFYFNRVTGRDLSLEAVQGSHTADLGRPRAESGNEWSQATSGMRVLTFVELKSLIEQGKTDEIPNNKIIPDVLNDSVPSASTAPLRRKPWELTSQS